MTADLVFPGVYDCGSSISRYIWMWIWCFQVYIAADRCIIIIDLKAYCLINETAIVNKKIKLS